MICTSSISAVTRLTRLLLIVVYKIPTFIMGRLSFENKMGNVRRNCAVDVRKKLAAQNRLRPAAPKKKLPLLSQVSVECTGSVHS